MEKNYEKRIGILTFHRADNLGAVLQAYALSKYLKEYTGITTEIINYICKKVEDTRYAQSKNIVKRVIYSMYYKIKRHGFDRFRMKYLPLSDKEYTKEDIVDSNDVYSIFITGSDQVWNIFCSDNDITFFLDFVTRDNDKIAYAASIGSIDFNEREVTLFTKYLNGFKAISVREHSSIAKLNLSQKTQIMPDPVFLLDKEQWKGISNEKKRKKKYVLVYIIQENHDLIEVAKKYARKNDYDVIINKKSCEFILSNSPDSFLSWLENAEAIFTNSFHGTAFSIIYRKLLAADISLKNGKTNNRIKELLQSAQLECCIISEQMDVPVEANAPEWLELQKEKADLFFEHNLLK